MKQRIHFLEYLYCHLLIVFLLGRMGFILYNRDVEPLSLMDAASACWRGFVGHDLMVAAVLLAVPWLVGLLALKAPGLKLRAWLIPYYIIMGLTVAAIIVGDCVMYEFWQFKLSMVVLSYAASPEGATNSVSLSFILVRAFAFLALLLWIVVPCIFLTPKALPSGRTERLWMRNISIIWTFLLVSAFCFMEPGDVYTAKSHPTQLADHAAVNPVYAFARSIRLRDDYSLRYDFLSEADRTDYFKGLYPEPADDIQDTLLLTRRPDILVVFVESFGSRFVEELGGVPGVAPCLSRLIPEGIFWQNYYSNSFRTDRGTVSAFSGWLSYADVGLMKQAETHAFLPSLARSLGREGYETAFLYGGAMTNMGKRKYVEDMDFKDIFTPVPAAPGERKTRGDEMLSLWEDAEWESWGVCDSTALQKTCQLVKGWKGGRHFMVAQTISSHEPWDVPYHRLPDKVLNAFAYTDHSIGCMVDSLRQLPQWDSLLVVILPDHGYLYRQSYKDPGFFHSPMLWLGGAIRQPRAINVLMNQSDLPATLLSQMGIPHQDFPWSRNVLSRTYTYPFVYSNWPAGLLFADSTGTTICDIEGDVTLLEQPADGGLRAMRAKAIMQTSYDQLDEKLRTLRSPSPHAENANAARRD